MTEENISLDRYFAAVWRAKWLIIIAVAGAAALTAYLGYRQPALYTASALVEVGRVWKEPLQDIYATAEVINSPGFMQRLAERSGIRAGQLRRSVRAEPITAGPPRARYPILIRITATTESAEESKRLAVAVTDALIEEHGMLFEQAIAPHLQRQQRLEDLLKDKPFDSSLASRELAIKLQTELDDVKSNNLSPTVTEKTHIVEQVVADGTSRPTVWRSVAVSAFLALVATLAAAILLEMMRPGGALKSRAAKPD
jgi:hypothetical protein